jgi:hypothetical protein
MLLDANLAFVAVGSPQTITSTAASTTVLDFLGVGSGNASTNIIGTPSVFGTDLGIGREKQQIAIAVGTAFTTGGGATLTVTLDLAPDNGSNSPGTYQTVQATPAYTAAQLAASTMLYLEWPPVFPASLRPRFARLNFVVATSTFSAGTIRYAVITAGRDNFTGAQQIGPNYVVA